MSPRNEAPSPHLRRVYLLRRLLVLFLLIGLAGLGAYLLLGERILSSTAEEIPSAPLQVVELLVENGKVSVAAYVPEGTTEEDARQSILSIYKWSQKFHPAVNCGPEAEESCAVGSTTILLLSSSEVRLINGQMAQAYVTTAQLELNQFLIAQLLAQPPATFDDLLSWHSFAQNVGAGSFEDLPQQPFLQLSTEASGGG
ncbi:MAG: hypothetical protein HYX86_04265 [Chloroflexi bacterium]|nr:hypothetical protein [Chloroflexota bacterium]